MTSQHNIEVFLSGFFTTPGTFLEIGCWNGELISQTSYLEKQKGWKGLCVDPFPIGFEDRTAQLCSRAVSMDGKTRDFIKVSIDRRYGGDVSYFSGFKESVTSHWPLISEHCDYEEVKVETVTMDQLYEQYNLPHYIEFLSVDTEGSEVEIFKSINFARYSFGLIVFEHNKEEAVISEVGGILKAAGYVKLCSIEIDDIYINKALVSKNIGFSKLGHHGRLANQLFQVVSTSGIAEKNDGIAVFPDWPYEQYFEQAINHKGAFGPIVKEDHFNYYEWDIQGNADLLGYMQSEKYFGKFSLTFKSEFLQEQKSKFNIWDKATICIHVRRGDYVGNKNYWQTPVTYFIDSLYNYFPQWRSCNLLFISDDIEYCRTHFECLGNAYFSVGNSDVEDMALGSCCDHFIIQNSSYGWWTAYLGEKPGTKVIHPGYMFSGPLSNNNTIDFWPERWIRNQKDSYKIPLLDVTFTIPVFHDHLDRLANLNLSLCLLQKDFQAEFIVTEQGGDKFKYTEKFAVYAQDNSAYFHRTKMLNDMAKACNTPVVVNWDCDVIVPPMQIIEAVEAIRNGADMVFPYDGRFARMPREKWFKVIESRLDIGVVGNTMFKNRHHGHNSVGGAVFFSKAAFIDGGMENEHMISFGPEDCERHDRFKILGYKIEYIKGSLFHMDHFCGPNSSPRNPYFKANHEEINKIRLMSPQELREYINSWEWLHPKQ